MNRRDRERQRPSREVSPPVAPVPTAVADRASAGRKDAEREIDEARVGVTLGAVARELLECSWNQAREAITRGKVSIDGKVVTDPAKRLALGQSVALMRAAPRVDRAESVLDSAAIRYVDEQIVVVDKPAGLSTIPFEEGERGTLVDRVQQWLHKKRGAGANAPLFVVHRIDKDTSGLVVFGRTWLAKRHLAGLFRAHAIERRYLALVCGHPSRDRWTVDTILVDDRGDGLRGSMRGGPASAGKRAITHIEVLERLDRSSLVRCQLETGRTHQIRIHLAESGHPLVGERVYGRAIERPIECERAMLHARELGFSHPSDAERLLRLTADIPVDFAAALAALGGSKTEW